MCHILFSTVEISQIWKPRRIDVDIFLTHLINFKFVLYKLSLFELKYWVEGGEEAEACDAVDKSLAL